MANPVTLRVHYKEDVDYTSIAQNKSMSAVENRIEAELTKELEALEGVTSVSVDTIHAGAEPYQAEVTVEFDESTTSSDTVEYEVSTISFVHNAIA